MRITNSKIEYLEHGLNFSKYCPQCLFCYMLRWRENKKPESDEDTWPRIQEEVSELDRQLRNGFTPKGEIMMSTSHDPFAQHCKRTGIEALKVLQGYPKVTAQLRVLSKKLSQVIPAATEEVIPRNARYGATITTMSVDESIRYCPGADPPMTQINALRTLNALGYHTWVSLEPCFYFMRIPNIVAMLPFVDEAVIGKLNKVRNDPNEYSVLSRKEFKFQIAQTRIRFPDVKIVVKKELKKWLDKR